jgi:hypothetical protein
VSDDDKKDPGQAAKELLEELGVDDDPQAKRLVKMAEERFKFGRAEDDEPFAVPVAGPKIVRLLRGGRNSLRAELSLAFYKQYDKVPNSSALADALTILQALAQLEPRQQLHVRVASAGPATYLDLGDESGRAVEIGATGWKVVQAPPVLFKRPEGLLPLVEPISCGAEIWQELLNIKDDDELSIVLAWLVAALKPNIPHCVLLLMGQQGAAKTWAAKTIAGAIDPSSAQVVGVPKDQQDWTVAAAATYVVSVDNLSRISEWLSDAICRASTGEGLRRRALYTDSALSILSFRRSVILTGIDLGGLKPDLSDRLLTVELQEIGEEARREDEEVAATFGELAPYLLGSVLDLAVQVRQTPVNLARKPRMADFARILASVDQIRGTDGFEVYLEQRNRLQREAAEGDQVAVKVLHFIATRPGVWEGTATDLLEKLTPERPPANWPKTPRGLTGALRRITIPLRASGVEVEFLPRTTHTAPAGLRLVPLVPKMTGNGQAQQAQAPEMGVLGALGASDSPPLGEAPGVYGGIEFYPDGDGAPGIDDEEE